MYRRLSVLSNAATPHQTCVLHRHGISSAKQYQNNPRYNYLEGKNFTQVSGACRGVGVGGTNSNSDAVSLTLRPDFTVLKQDSGRSLGSGVCQRARQCLCSPFQSWTDTTELVQ